MAAALFKRLLRWLEEQFERRPISQPARAMLGGAVVGIIASLVPDVAGNGYEPLNAILNGDLVWSAAIVLGLAKIFATSGAVASGIPGGVFTAMLLVGGALGTGWGHLLGFADYPTAVSVGSFALVGMAATTAASIHAPLTAAVLVFELSRSRSILTM
jgi:CIC family chloride channel protein